MDGGQLAHEADDGRLYLRVAIDSTGVVVGLAGAGEYFEGITQEDVGSGELISVKDKKDPGTHICTASEAIAAGAALYGAASGKVSDTVSGPQIGLALEAALADGDQIECKIDPDIGLTWL